MGNYVPASPPLPLAVALQRATTASQNAFALGLQRAESAAAESRDQQLADRLTAMQQADDQRIADLAQAQDFLQQALNTLTEASNDLRTTLQTERDETQKSLDDNQKAIDKQTATQQKALDQLGTRLKDYQTRVDGLIALVKGDLPGTRFPWATGDIRRTINAQGWPPPPGWLLCDGGEVQIHSYPELSKYLGSLCGVATRAGYFVLPSRAQLAGNPWELAATAVQWWIRT
ncbi:MAG: tail fiber protein [Phycisphaerae bacterium]|nr:tail fiber protein [Phycisphaerae bacterium]